MEDQHLYGTLKFAYDEIVVTVGMLETTFGRRNTNLRLETFR